MSKETKLGIFVIAAAVSVAVVIMILGDFTLSRGYSIYILFSDIAGLPSKAQAKIAGVNVGKVKDITLYDGKARLEVWIKKSVKIHTDTQARIIATGIIGSKYLELTSGSPDKPLLKDGDTIRGIDPVSLDKMISSALESVESLMSSLKPSDGKSVGQNISEAVSNIKDVTETLKKAVYYQEKKVVDIVSNIHSISRRLDSISANVDEIIGDGKTDLKITIANLKDISEKLDRIVSSIDAGDGIAGKLVKDKDMGEDLKSTVASLKETANEAKRVLRRITAIDTEWNATIRYDTKYDLWRPDVGIRISPTPQKYYYFGGRNLGAKRKVFDPEERNNIDFHVGLVRPYGSIYAGVVRSQGGVGFTVKPFYRWTPWKKLEIYAEGYDFFRSEPSRSPNVTLGGRANIYKFINVGGQVEDIAYEKNFNVYVNLLMKDNDIGYLLGLVGLARP